MSNGDPMNEPFALQARAIRKSFGGVEVLHGVDLDATGGSVLALLGENGAGKSTLVRVLAGDHIPDGGEIVIGGESHAALDPVTARALGVRMIFQELSDAPALTVAENISLGRWPARRGMVRWKTIRERAVRALDELGVNLDPDQPVA
jgi:ribose transport system ATP-binding protein